MGDIRCLEQNDGALHSCVVDLEANTVASKSTDDGKTWTPELRYDQVAGIKQCPADSDVAVACTDLWLLISISFKGQQANPPVVVPSPSPKKSGCSSIEPAGLALLCAFALRRRR
jgi:MYXO-CTERM domain-containing protein